MDVPNLNFTLNLKKSTKEGLAPIYLRITINGSRTETQQWLKHVFDHIMDTNIQKIENLLPKNYKLTQVENQSK